MRTIWIHDELAFVITVISFPNAHVAIVTAADSTVPVRHVCRDMPSVRLAIETAQTWIRRTF